MWYGAAITVIAIIAMYNRKKSVLKYKTWKSDTISIFGFKREWVANEDDLLQQLWDENQRLEGEVKVLTEKYKNLSFALFFMALLAIVFGYFFSRKKLN